MQRMEVGYKILSLVNFLAFLLNGRLVKILKSELISNLPNYLILYFEFFNAASLFNLFYTLRYRSLLDRLLRMRLVYNRRHSIRQINFEFMNRQLVWHGFTVHHHLFIYLFVFFLFDILFLFFVCIPVFSYSELQHLI